MTVMVKTQGKGADFALTAAGVTGDVELGAAWVKSGDYGDYVSVKIDGPLFAEPINAMMALKPDDKDLFALRWNRPKAKAEG